MGSCTCEFNETIQVSDEVKKANSVARLSLITLMVKCHVGPSMVANTNYTQFIHLYIVISVNTLRQVCFSLDFLTACQ